LSLVKTLKWPTLD